MSRAFTQLAPAAEAALLAGVRGGAAARAAAFEALYRALREPVLALCLDLTGRRDHAELDGQHPAPGGGEPALQARDQARRLQAAVAALPAEHRAVLALFALEGLGHAAIAEILGIPEGTVWSRLHVSRRRLAETLGREPAR